MTYAITVNGANKHYGDFAALDNIDFVVPAGSLTALLGPSGSGKSTLLRAIAGLDEPDTGTITINGRDVTRVPPQKRGIGFVFQHYAAFKHLTVRDNVGVRAEDPQEAQGRDQGQGRQPAGSGGAGRFPEPLPQSAVRRPAPAHGSGARAGRRSGGAAARRAVRRAGRQGPRGPAGVAAPSARRGARDHGAGDPRPGGGARRRRPDRGAQQGPHRAGRFARPRSTTPRPTRS